MSLAQRWEKPATDQDERRAIMRARRLCEDNSETSKSSDVSSGLEETPLFNALQDSDKDSCILRLKNSNSFLGIAWLMGVRPTVVTDAFRSMPISLIAAVSYLEDTLALIPSNHQQPLASSTFLPEVHACPNEMSVVYRLNPDTKKRTGVEVSDEFCKRFGGITQQDFRVKSESEEFPLPCSTLQYICYFIDGTLCIGQGLTSWTRSVHCQQMIINVPAPIHYIWPT
jgi:hypothetical protein